MVSRDTIRNGRAFPWWIIDSASLSHGADRRSYGRVVTVTWISACVYVDNVNMW